MRSATVVGRALVTLGRVEEARELLGLRLATAGTCGARLMAEKALADMSFYAGDVEPVVEWFRSREDERFPQAGAAAVAGELITGKRVVIVGPSARFGGDGALVGSLRDEFDLIVRTNLAAGTVVVSPEAPAADVVYFNSGISRLGLRSLVTNSAVQGVRQVVLRRPRELQSFMPDIERGVVRFVEVEPGCHLRASSFGAQRIIYDLAVHEPASIDVRNVDFFTGEIEYAEGYKVENADVSFRGFSHDFRGDFLMSHHLAQTGAVRFDELASSILNTSAEDYLARLDAKPPVS